MLTNSGLVERLRQSPELSGDVLTENELGHFLAERVRVVVEDVVLRGLVPFCHVSEQVIENFFGDL